MSKLTTLLRYLNTPRRYSSSKKIAKIQNKAVLKHVKFVRQNSKFYRDLWQGYTDEEWREFPIIDKAVMMENLQELITVDLDISLAKDLAQKAEKSRDFSSKIGPFTIGFSSGTSGFRGMHIVSESEQAAWAGFMLARGLGSSIFGKHRIGLVLRANSNTFESIGSNRIKFQFYDLMKPVEQLHQEILNDDLDILICPPSVLSYFVEMQSELKFKRIISVAEVLEDVDRNKIESYFGLTLHQFYSSTEGEIAATCEHGTLHLNEGVMVIQKEWLDQEKGWYHPIITDFRRKSQPIIRYRLNDILVTSNGTCPCGDAREVISSIMGRSDDVFHLSKHDDTIELVVPDLIRRAIMQMSDEITDYIAIQKSPSQIEIQIKPDNLEDLSIAGFDDLWQSKNIQPPKLDIKPYTHVPSATKLRRIYRQFK
jgi:putative adenylate-forming enzyme